MLARVAPKWLTGKIIQTGYYAESMSIALVKCPFEGDFKTFKRENPMKFFECRFYSYLASKTPPGNFANKYEAKQYDIAAKKLEEFAEVLALCERFNEYFVEIREISVIISKDTKSSNLFSRSFSSQKSTENDISDYLDKYNQLLELLEPYPEWRRKVIDDIGRQFHVMHNTMSEGEAKQELFKKLNRHDFFV